jgi:predicted ATPase
MVKITRSQLSFDPALDQFSEERKARPLTVFSGANNSGKSLVLKYLKQKLGRGSYMIGTNRFYHVYHFTTGVRDPDQAENFEQQFQGNFNQEQYNYEQNVYDLNSIIVGLGDIKRNKLFDLCSKLIGNHFSMKKVDEDNDLSNRYIDMDGQNLSVASTGTRLLMTILGICMDDRFDTILIDEPELGLGPKVQQTLADFLNDVKARENYFPHLKRIYLATHSHLFLSRAEITDNFIVSKSGLNIKIEKVINLSDFHRLQFNLLGNSLEHMFFPSAIVVVEGKTDHEYIERIIQNLLPDRRITIIQSGGDIKRKIAGLKEAFGDLMKSPLRSRLFAVLDLVHQKGLKDELIKMGMFADNVIIWEKNGIEYLYPPDILAGVFACDVSRVSELSIDGDRISINGIEKTKNELKTEILARIVPQTIMPKELEEKLLVPLAKSIL